MSTTEKHERFLRLAHRDIQNSASLPEFQDASMPGVLERPSLLTMTRLWDADTWVQHRAIGRWWIFVKGWPSSSILKAIRLPLSALTIFAACVIALNQLLVAVGLARLTLPLAPLSLQASTVGLLLVFRNNQTHDRLKEAQRALGGLGALGREVLHLLLVHAPPERTRDVGHAARLLALFGWALKAECRGEPEALRPLAEVLLPRAAHGWLLAHECRSTAVLLRLRAVVGQLRSIEPAMSADAFKFVEERLAKLSAVEATCSRLVTFPVPPSYHRHGSRALMLWLGSLPFVLEGLGCHPLQTLVSVAASTFLLLGIDQIAIEIEQPLDVLPLHAFAQRMSNDVALALQSWWQMPALPAAADDEDGEEDDGLPSPLGPRAGQRASAAPPGATSRKKKAS